MTINSETRVAGPFDGNDSTVSFPFTFKVFDSDEVRVVAETGAVETDLELGTDYTVTLNADQNAAPGGSVVLAAPLATGTRLTLTSALEMLQPVDLTNQSGFYPRVINSALDRLTILLQQLASVVSRTLKFPLSDGPVGDLPGRSVRAGTVLAFDEATGEPVAGPDISSVNGVAGALVAINTVAPHVDAIEVVADNIEDVTNFSGVYYGSSATDPATRRDGSPLQVGDLYFYTVTNALRTYNGTAWRESVSGAVTVQNLSGDGVETEFLLNYAPESEVITNVFIDGVYQQKNTYALGGANGDVLIFDAAPPVGAGNIEVVVSSLIPSDDKLRQELANGTAFLVDGEMVGGLILPINSIAELRARAGRYDGDVAYLRGRTESSTLGAGQFKWDAASTLADDDGVVIGAAATGRWFRIGTNFECHGEWFGVGNDGADYTTQLQNAINYAGVAVSGGQGMRVQLLRGKVGLSNKITLPNRVAVHGANGRGTVIEALDTFEPTATEMFHAHNGTSSMFGSRLVDLFIDMRGKGDVNGRCIYSQAWQETCGMERVCLIGFPKYGLEYSDGYGGAAYLPLKDIEIFGGASGTTPTAGIKINQVSQVGGFVLSIDGATITGATSAQCPAGISMTNDTLVARGLHFEYVDNGVVGSGIGGISIDTITGSSNNVGTLVALGSAWTGQLNIRNSIANGATNHVKNNANGAVIPSGAGMQPEITYPDKAQSAALGYVIFDASATAVNAQCTIVSKSANISGVLKTAVGKFTVQWLYTMPDKQRSVGGGIVNLDNTDPIKVTHTGSTGSSEVVQVRRKSGDTTWGDYDPQRCSLQFFGDRL